MDIKIPYKNVTDQKQAYALAKNLVGETLSKFGVKAQIDYDEGAHALRAKGTGFEAKIAFETDHVTVALDLSFLLKPLKTKIIETLEKQLKKVV